MDITGIITTIWGYVARAGRNKKCMQKFRWRVLSNGNQVEVGDIDRRLIMQLMSGKLR
jgi:hypothetical protein